MDSRTAIYFFILLVILVCIGYCYGGDTAGAASTAGTTGAGEYSMLNYYDQE